ncbi:hypothetical protein CALCODRAFT_513765 [Calocera cornea HHB12733]|uniref:Autophagy-related protein 29 n=1 Tax=Calocera cornea HHB12733 TaxID=1353952 RepID=A0A165K9P1_9BASI|nr:hypothetical protein CALCODRAFT_513765 [Calocera cornea HHB12733]
MSRPVQLIVRLPYNRPQDGSVSNPPIIHWTPDKEQLFWEVITKSRDTEGSSIEWSALADHLEVPLPYLLYRAGKRFEEGLQNLKAVTGSPDPQTAEGSKKERRPSNAMLRRLSGQNSTAGAGRASPLHLSPKAGTIRLAGSGYQSGLHARAPSSSSIATMTHRGPHPTSGRPFSVIQSGSSSSSDEEGAAEDEENEQLMEKEEAARRIRELERLVNQNTLQFAQPVRSHVSPSPRRTRTVPQKPRSEASSSVHTDRYEASASVSPSSPASLGAPPQVTPRREETQSSPSPPLSAFQRGRQPLRVSTSDRTAGSTAPSTSSSFSDISDVSTSALEEAAAGSTFRPAPSRLTVFARNHLGRLH